MKDGAVTNDYYIRNNARWKLEGHIALCCTGYMLYKLYATVYLRTWYHHLISYNSYQSRLARHTVDACHRRMFIAESAHAQKNNACAQ